MRRFAIGLVVASALVACDSAASLGLAARARAARNYAEAATQFRAAYEACPARRELLLETAQAQTQARAAADAIRTLRDYLAEDPGSVAAHTLLANAYLLNAQLAEARAAAERVLNLKPGDAAAPDYAWPWVNLAGLLITRGENDRAFSAAVEAVKRDPGIARGFYTGGKALLNLGRHELSLKWLERAAALDPANPDPLYLLARAYDRSGRKDDSREALRRFQDLRAKTPSRRR